MDLQVESDGLIRRVTVAGALDIYAAREFHDRIADCLSHATEVELGLGDVPELDTACLQIMISAKRDAVARSKTLRFKDHSKAVLATIELCRLESQFGDPLILTDHEDASPHQGSGA